TRRFTRLTNAFSKKVENHMHACQGRTQSTSVAAAKIHQFKGRWGSWVGFWQGEREGELPVIPPPYPYSSRSRSKIRFEVCCCLAGRPLSSSRIRSITARNASSLGRAGG